jgi:hypothetical protein
VPERARLARIPLLLLAILSLLLGMAGGLARLGWSLGPVPPMAIAQHGTLMVAGFLGTLIALERAVAARRSWAYAGPLFAGLGALALVAASMGAPARWLLWLGAAVLVAVLGNIGWRVRTPFALIQLLGALGLAVGSALWAAGRPIPDALPWWAGFLLLTIAGERLELSRILQPPLLALRLFAAIALLLGLGALLAGFDAQLGWRLGGCAWLGLALWLARWDLARRSVRRAGLPRFMAIALLSGYAWLGLAGILAIRFGAPGAGPVYDAILHCFLLGFVFVMIFAHAPVIFPTVLGLAMPFRKRFYSHLALLHLGLALRVASDLAGWTAGRQWGGAANAVAILLFLVQTVSALERR